MNPLYLFKDRLYYKWGTDDGQFKLELNGNESYFYAGEERSDKFFITCQYLGNDCCNIFPGAGLGILSDYSLGKITFTGDSLLVNIHDHSEFKEILVVMKRLGGWMCKCGHFCTEGKFCTECGSPKP